MLEAKNVFNEEDLDNERKYFTNSQKHSFKNSINIETLGQNLNL